MRAPRFIRITLWSTTLAVLGLAAAAARAQGVETSAREHDWLPETVSTFGHSVDHLFYYILYLTVAINIAVFIAMAVFLVRYRYKPGRRATFIHGNNRLETVWTLVPTIILALTAAFSESTWSRIKVPPQAVVEDKNTIEIEVVAQQFLWNFHYAGKDGKLGPRKTELINKNGSPDEQIGLDRSDPSAKDDFVSNVMYIPVNRKVYLHVASRDVIHSFFLPNFRIKQDAVPGMVTKVWLESEKTSAEVVGTNADGTPKPFDIACAELCGQGHFKMRGQLYVVSEADYQKWLDQQAKANASENESGY